MQRIITFIIIVLITLSCSNDIEFNTPSFQGTKNNVFWRADNFQATISENGEIKIIGVKNSESLTISVSSTNEGIYNLGSVSNNSIVFQESNFTSYSTLNNGNGEIVIENYDSLNLTITGTFKFNAYSSTGEVLNFVQGIFYKIPISVPSTPGEIASSSTFRASINDVLIELENIETNILDGQLLIKAKHTDNSSIELFLPENIQLGSYTLNSATQIYANYVFPDGSLGSSQYGTLNILEHNQQFKKIKATFLFNTGHPHNVAVTNGSFIVFY